MAKAELKFTDGDMVFAGKTVEIDLGTFIDVPTAVSYILHDLAESVYQEWLKKRGLTEKREFKVELEYPHRCCSICGRPLVISKIDNSGLGHMFCPICDIRKGELYGR